MSEQPKPPGEGNIGPDKLVGAWTAGTLSDAERRQLVQGALENQALFDALAEEEGLRELMADPATRAELAELVAAPTPRRVTSETAAAAEPIAGDRGCESAKPSWWQWLFRPAPMAAFSAGAVAVLAFVVLRPTLIERPVHNAQVVNESSPAKPAVVLPGEPQAGGVAELSEERKGQDARAPKGLMIRSGGRMKAGADDQLRDKEAAAEPKEKAKQISEKADAPPTPVTPSARAVADNKTTTLQFRAPEQPPASPGPAPSGVVVVQIPAQAPAVTPPAPTADAETARRATAVVPAPPPPGAAAAAPAVRYRIEREQPTGEWVEFGGELARGDRARVAVTAAREGVLEARTGAESLVVQMRAGQTVRFPSSGSFASDPGEREVAIVFRPGALLPADGSALRIRSGYGGIVGGVLPRRTRPDESPRKDESSRKKEAQQPAASPASAAQSSVGSPPAGAGTEAPVTLTVRLRFR